jgi:hypothetical protein
MVDQPMADGAPEASICPWCSASYAGTPEDCPSCGATLVGDPTTDSSLPGLTAIDAAAIVRSKEPVKRSRNRLVSWISGDYPDAAAAPTNADALARPDADVRREMLRLELEAEVARLQAEADAMLAEAAAEGRLPNATPADLAAAGLVAAEIESVEHDLDATLEELETDPLGAAPAPAVIDAPDGDPGAAAST